MSNSPKHVLVAGATGNVGQAAVERFLEDPDYDVTALARRRPEVQARPRYAHVPVDIRDGSAVVAAIRDASQVTHVVYTALFEKSDLIAGWVDPDQIDTNRLMFANVLDALQAVDAPVRHISILQGTKAYGYHLAPMRIPGKESQPRVDHGNFYWTQEDLLIDAAASMGATYSIFRPQFIFGGVLGAAMNLVPVLGVYAALCHELGRPFSFPGGAPYVAEAVDSRLLAGALHWAADAPTAANETFNITNGDVFSWRDLWPSFARALDVETGPDEPMSLSRWLPEQEATWQRVVEHHGLRPLTLAAILGLSHQYADDAFAWTPDGSPLASRSAPVHLSTIKLRMAGFGQCVDTEEMFAYWLAHIRARRIVP